MTDLRTKSVSTDLLAKIDFSPFDKIIIAPLNWGLGHATRSMVIINHLLSIGKEVIIVGDGLSLQLLKNEYPKLSYFDLEPYDVNYSGNNFVLAMLRQLPKIKKAIWKENKQMKELISKTKADLIISDNRYGVYHKKIPSYIITHQTQPHFKNPIFKRMVQLGVSSMLSSFDQIWIPDFQDRRLTGSLSKSKSNKIHFVGPLSRLKIEQQEKKYNKLIILSGPEPSRTNLEEKLFKLVEGNNNVLVRGINQATNLALDQKFDLVFNLATTKELESLIGQSKKIICRSGYSSVMDLYKMPEKLLLIPTPGQSEQEYLAKHLKHTLNIEFSSEEGISKDLINS